MSYVKEIAELAILKSIPSDFVFSTSNDDFVGMEAEEAIPIIDFSLLTSGVPVERSKMVQGLGKACREWGIFLVTNHGVTENLREAMLDAGRRFFDLTQEEKREYEGKHVLDPIRCGTSFNVSVDKVMFWRDFLKLIVHPQFHSIDKPSGFSEISLDYSKRTREVGLELLRGISESLGFDESHLAKVLEMDSGLQLMVINLYPPCPQPELAMGLPPHSDYGLLTILIQNGIDGFQVQHNGKWINVNPLPGSFLINVGDQIEILSNGKYRSALHRAVVNGKATRMSLGIVLGPSMDAEVKPESKLVDHENNRPTYRGIKFKEYLTLQQSSQLDRKSSLDRLRI